MAANTQVLLKTNHGDIKLSLNEEKAPKTTANFINYVKADHYNKSIFHRVIDGFMVQGGGFDENMSQKPTKETVENEADNGLQNKVGSIAMARTSEPHSASAQFFINVADNSFLDHTAKTDQGWGYAVFGEVTDGMDVVNKIAKVKTGTHGVHQDVPSDPVIINEATLIESE